MEKLPTAEEFLLNELNKETPKSIQDVLIEFAKLHVEAALKQASEKADVIFEGAGHSADAYVDKKSILNSYPLTNIK
jgi:hypothetical protein